MSHTWCDNGGHRHTFQIILGGIDTDVILCPRVQVLQHAGGFVCSDKLLEGVSSLAIGRRARHSVASDAY